MKARPCGMFARLPYEESAVERGFSVSEDLLVVNLHQQSLVAQRIVYNYFTSLNVKLHEYQIPADLGKSCKLVYSQ